MELLEEFGNRFDIVPTNSAKAALFAVMGDLIGRLG